MSPMAAWLVYCAFIAAMLGLAAASAESAARRGGRAGRWMWLVAMTGSVLLPAVAIAARTLLPGRAIPVPATGVIALTPVSITVDGGAGGIGLDAILRFAWIAASAVLLLWIGVGLLRLRHARKAWRRATVQGREVWITRDLGPAVYGVRGPSILLPEWALALNDRLQRLLLLHEGEHVRAGDPRTVLAGLAFVIAMPWNLPLWWQFARLRMAIEMDCDARVLRRDRDTRAYGALLLEVGRRRSRGGLVVAFSEPRIFLERRIRQITARAVAGGRRRIAALCGLAVVLLAAAFCARDPLAPRNAAESGAQLAPAAADITERPVFTPMTVRPVLENPAQVAATLRRNYPPLLRDAGIEGTATVWFLIDGTGQVLKTQLNRSSGYEALDEAALRVAETMRFRGALNRNTPVTVWVQIPIAFARSGEGVVLDRVPVRVGAPAMAADTPPARLLPTPAPATGITDRPVFTPMTVRPTLRNAAEVSKALAANYPPLLKDAGIAGTVIIWFYIDETGLVQKTQIAKSSGYEALDKAALGVAGTMRFGPAVNRDKPVPVWVQIPVSFGTGGRESASEDAATRAALAPARTDRRPPADRVQPLMEQPARSNAGARPPRATGADDVLRKLNLTNADEIGRALQENYPPLLRDAGIGGTAIVWAYVDETGRVLKLQLNQSSGYESLDEAAMRVAAKLRYEPATDSGRRIATWTAIPISFQSK